MKTFSKVALGAIALAVGVGGVGFTMRGEAGVKNTAATDGTDSLTASSFSLSGSYSGKTYSSTNTGAVYLINATINNSAIQMRSKNNSGLICTTSAGTINSITISFANSTTTGKVVNIYGTNTAYKGTTSTGAAELYTAGLTPVGSVTYQSGTADYTYSFSTAYSYFGLRSDDGAIYLSSISVKWGALTDVPATGLSLSKTAISGLAGGSETLEPNYTPTNTTHRTVDWTTSNSSIATVSDGVVSYIAVGTATITAKLHDQATISATCSVTVAEAETYSLVTSITDIHIGAQVVFVNKTSSKAMADAITNSSYMDQATITLGESTIKQVNHIGLFTFGVGAAKDTFTFKNKADSKYLTAGSSGTALVLGSSESASSDWSISLGTGSLATLTANNRYLFYNTAYSDFASSTTAPTTGQEIYLYQKAATTGQLDTVEATGTLTKSIYKPGDVFDATGLTINGMFDDADTTIVDLTKWVVWPTTPIVLGQTTVTGTVTVQGVSKTIVQNITVEEVTLSKIEITTQATTTTFPTGGVLDTTGLAVTATYSNSTTEDVTTKCTITPANGSTLSTAGTTAVEIAYLGKTTSYNITVETAAHTLKKVTSVDQLVVGAQIVIASSQDSPSAMVKTQSENNRDRVAIAPNSDSLNLLSSSTAAVFTLGVGTSSGTYSFHDTNGYLFAASSSKNYLQSENTLDSNKNGDWAITIANDGAATVTAQGNNTHNIMRFNNGSSLFSCYTSGQTAIRLYEQTTYYNAASWAIGFNTALDATCSNTAPTAIASSTWSDQSTSFGSLGTEEKAILKAISTADANDGTAAKKAISRYDYVMGKAAYSSFADFIGRFPSRGVSPSAFATATDGKNFVLPLVTFLATTGAIALFFISKKKRHE